MPYVQMYINRISGHKLIKCIIEYHKPKIIIFWSKNYLGDHSAFMSLT